MFTVSKKYIFFKFVSMLFFVFSDSFSRSLFFLHFETTASPFQMKKKKNSLIPHIFPILTIAPVKKNITISKNYFLEKLSQIRHFFSLHSFEDVISHFKIIVFSNIFREVFVFQMSEKYLPFSTHCQY